jgi:hypothetical protein
LAENHGGSLTINPETGLPEAGFLDKLLPAIIGFALAPMTAGTSLAFLGATPFASALTVGGIEALRTGDIGKGISAGLGAYGGAGLQASLATAGTAALGSEAARAGAGITADMAANLADAGITDAGIQSLGNVDVANQALQQQAAERVAAASPFDRISAGFDAAKANPSSLLTKDNFKYLGAAAAPILADQAVKSNLPTTATKPGMIRPYSFDPYGGTYTAGTPYEATPTKAAGGGLMGMNDGGYSPGQLDFTQRSEPVVRMARGGVAHFEDGGGVNEYDYAPGGGGSDYYANQFASDVFAPIATPTSTDNALAAYQAGNYGEASRLLGEAGMSAQDVVSKYGLSQADAATVAQNLGYAGDMGGIQYAAAPPTIAASTPAYFTQNPDVAAAFAQNSYGMTPEAFAQTHYTNFGQAEGRTLGGTGGAPVDSFANQFAPDVFAPVVTSPVATTPVADTGGGLAALNTAATNPYYFQVNPDVAAEYARNPMGLTPDQFAQAHYTNFGQKEGREFAPSAAVSFAKANNQDLVTNTLKWIDANPFATPEQINAAIKGSGMSTGDVNRALDSLVASGKISGSERYYIQQGKGLSAMADNTAKWLKDNPNATQTQIDAVLKAASMDIGDAQQVLAHGFQVADKDLAAATKYIQDNPDVARWITSDQGKAYVKAHPEFDAKDIAFTHYERYGKKEGRKWGEDAVKPPVVVPPVVTPPITYNTAGTNAPGGLGSVLGLPPGVSGAGITTVNPNGTITTRPNIPGIPEGGFTGMTSLRDAYEKGGGSLGVNKNLFAPKTQDELFARYKNTGGSKAAFDYLMGKTPYSPTPYTPTGEIMKPYFESVGRFPENRKAKKYVFVNGKYELNPDYVEPSYVLAGRKAAADKAAAAAEKPKIDTPVTGQNDGGGGGGANGGLMKLARGGMSQQFDLGGYSDGGRLLRGPGDGVSDSIPATIGNKRPARLADGEFVVPARIVSELGNGSTEAGARKLYAMMDRVQKARRGTVGKGKVAKNSRSDKYLPA